MENEIALTDLRVVLAVEECASFTRASHKLGISQPAVSRRIALLEQRLGVRLFRREGQKFHTTEAGAVFCTHAAEMLEGMRLLETETIGVSTKPKGSVALGVPPSTGEFLLRTILPEYRRQYPKVKIRVEQGYVGDIFEMLMSRQVDVALLNGRYNPSDVYLEPLYDHFLGIVYPAKWQERSPFGGPMPDEITMEQVARLPLFLPSKNQSLRTLIDEAFLSAHVMPEVDFEINSFVLQKSMVVGGHGCMFMSREAAIRSDDKGTLGFSKLAEGEIRYTLHLAMRQFGQPTLAAKLLAKMIKASKPSIHEYMNNTHVFKGRTI